MQKYVSDMKAPALEALELAKKLGATAAKFGYIHGISHDVSFESSRLKACSGEEKQDYSITVVVNHRSGSAHGNVMSAIPTVVERAITLAKNGAVSHFDEYPAPAESYREIRTYSPTVGSLNSEKLVTDCQGFVDRLLAADSSLIVDAGCSVEEAEGLVALSSGFYDEKCSSRWSIGGGFQKTSGTDMLFTGSGRSWGELNSLYDFDAIYDDVMFDLTNAARIVKVSSGTVPLILPPSVVKRFFTPVFMGIDGRNVFKGTSPLQDKLNTQCFSKAISILDDPFVDYSPAASSYDSAGIPTQKRMLIENGVLNLFLYDYDTACMAGKEPTGNSGCAPNCARIMPGTISSDELIKSVSHGIYVEHLLGFGQTNLTNGDFSANLALGFLIENGEIVGRVKDTMIAGNVFDLFKGDVQFSSNIHPNNRQPYMLLPGVTLNA
ncbi:MAG: TldD/PmbA family protein [Victivallales bacterium]|nr:TldD/PmbA family protein [Victivallales bacterium]